MTIDEAIRHCEEVAERYETRAKMIDRRKLGFALENPTACHECAADHRQLAEWLRELKDLREENKVLISECDRPIKEKGELLKKSEQIAEYKRLLKAAVEDFAVYGALKDLSSEQRVQNPDWRRFNRVFDVLDHQWRYADEALKLLNDEK